MDLEIIINPKVTSDGQAVIQVLDYFHPQFDTPLTSGPQLETAAGAAIKHFKGALPRVTTCIAANTQT